MYLDQTNVPKVFFDWSWLEGGEGGGEGRGNIRPENCRFLKILKLSGLPEVASVIILHILLEEQPGF